MSADRGPRFCWACDGATDEEVHTCGSLGDWETFSADVDAILPTSQAERAIVERGWDDWLSPEETAHLVVSGRAYTVECGRRRGEPLSRFETAMALEEWLDRPLCEMSAEEAAAAKVAEEEALAELRKLYGTSKGE